MELIKNNDLDEDFKKANTLEEVYEIAINYVRKNNYKVVFDNKLYSDIFKVYVTMITWIMVMKDIILT